jgi:hypothetical protein
MVKVSTVMYAVGDALKVFGTGITGITLLGHDLGTAGVGALVATAGFALDAAANRISQPGNGA